MQITVKCDAETKSALETFAHEHSDVVSGVRSIQPKNLDGDTATWIVLATLGAQVVPHFLNLFRDVLLSKRTKSVKVGDIVFENPTQEDLELMRKIVAAHAANENGRNDDSPRR